jgi:hypothetical protein
MKAWKGILVTAISVGMLFTGCKKKNLGDNEGLAAMPGAPATHARPVVQPNIGALLSYNVATVASARGSMLFWTAGNINATTISLDAAQTQGTTLLTLVHYSQPLTTTEYQLYSPIRLGNLNIPNATYADFKFAVNLSPTGPYNSLNLNGFYNRPTTSTVPSDVSQSSTVPNTVSVHLVINGQVSLKGEYAPSMVISRQDYYTLTIFFNPVDLTNGITAQMMDNAQRTPDDMIEISSTTNVGLYDIIIKNLQNAMTATFVAKDVLPSE